MNMNDIVGSHDLLFVTLDTLRYDVAVEELAAGRLPNLARVLPGGWERRHSPGSFTFAAHSAFFAGFLPTPDAPGRHPRLFAARFGGSETTADDTWVFDEPDLVAGLRKAGYRTVCVGGVGFFNPESRLGQVLPGYFDEAYWSAATGVADRDSFANQVGVVERVVAAQAEDEPLFLFVNVPALHQPNWFYLDGERAGATATGTATATASEVAGDTRASHAAALRYVDAHVGRLFALMAARRDCFTIVCSDHGTAYGEDGHVGHRIGHDVVWTVPYAEFVLPKGYED